ncbi:MAG: ABC transporter permease [Actinomycetota bacterium]|nr:ABC transporter permease [Actinomycetota bacterium]MDP9488193.1 ABC transporter permease [Actinomycetota bacterium]
MALNPATQTVADAPGLAAESAQEHPPAAGTSPWGLAGRRLRRNRVALAAGLLFAVLVLVALAAPLYARQIAETTPERNRVADEIVVDGERRQVVSLDGVPIGPTFGRQFFLGADQNGRDVMVRLLYGARNSLFIGVVAALITTLLAVALGLTSGFYRGSVDAVISRVFDVLWAFPVLLIGIALGVSLAIGGLSIGPISIRSNSIWVPTLIIGVVYIVYLARPLRGQVLSLREKEFVEAARAQGAGGVRIMASELLPNLSSTLLAFFPLVVANAVLLEAALSFLGAGVQPPNPSWGTMIADGLSLIISSPHLTVLPGAMLVLTVLALNIFGEGVRDALDPRARIRVER